MRRRSRVEPRAVDARVGRGRERRREDDRAQRTDRRRRGCGATRFHRHRRHEGRTVCAHRPAGLVRPGENYSGDPHTSWLTLLGRRNAGAAVEQVRAELAVIASQIDREQPGRTTTVILAPAALLSMPRDGATSSPWRPSCSPPSDWCCSSPAPTSRICCWPGPRGGRRNRRASLDRREPRTPRPPAAHRERPHRTRRRAAGSILAWWSCQALLPVMLSSLPGTVPPLRIEATPNLTALGFALGLAAVTAMIFGLVPALQASKPDVLSALKQGAIAGRASAGWLRGSLVGAQVAVCIVLLISSALLLRALYAVQTVEPGFAYQDVAVVSFDSARRGPTSEAAAFQRELTDRIAALPGVDDRPTSARHRSVREHPDDGRLPREEAVARLRREHRLARVFLVDRHSRSCAAAHSRRRTSPPRLAPSSSRRRPRAGTGPGRTRWVGRWS